MEHSMTPGGAAVALAYFALIAGTLTLPGWLRTRRQRAARLQAVLTDALDGALGAIVAPRLETPLLGPWRIEMALPFGRPDTVARILAIVEATLAAAEWTPPAAYRIVLASTPDASCPPRSSPVRCRWAGGRAAA